MKKSLECSTKPRPVSTGPPFSTCMVSAFSGSLIWSAFVDDLELHQQAGKIDAAGRAVDDDAHRPFRGMRAHVDDGALEARIAHDRHGDHVTGRPDSRHRTNYRPCRRLCGDRASVSSLAASSVPCLQGSSAKASLADSYPDIGWRFCQSSLRACTPDAAFGRGSQAIQWFAVKLACKDVLMNVIVPMRAALGIAVTLSVACTAIEARAEDSSPWQHDTHSAIRLLAGSRSGAVLLGGIDIKLQPGWKTYWRTPGDSGVPLRSISPSPTMSKR